MQLTDQTVLVTGANRGLGARFVEDLLTRGVRRIYAASRSGAVEHSDPRVVPLSLDVTDSESVAAAAKQASDTTVLINNAGVLAFGGLLDADLGQVERDWQTNALGLLRVTQAFVPVLRSNGPGAVVNVLTLIALAPVAGMGGYCASKAAAHSLTQGLRAELRGTGISVVGAYPGGIDTDMLAGVEAVKAAPEDVARRTLDALVAGESFVFPDDASAQAGAVYVSAPLQLETMLAG